MSKGNSIMPTSTRIRPWQATPQQAEYLKTIAPTRSFLHDLPDDVRRRYAGQWVAAQNQAIIASAATMAELMERLPDPDDPSVLVLRLEQGVTIRWRHS
jgi:hypothetical protein